MKKFTFLLMMFAGFTAACFAQTGYITTFAGTGASGYSGDGGQAAAARLNLPFAVIADGAGNIYISDYGADVIRKVNSAGIITTVAGNGTAGYTGDGGSALSAQLDGPEGIALDGAGNLYIAENSNNVIRKVSTSGIITTVAGNGYGAGIGTGGYTGDGMAATATELNRPTWVAVDASGDLFIADQFNSLIRKVDISGTISTFAGIPDSNGYSGDGGPATAAKLNGPFSLVLDGVGNVYISDEENYLIRKIDPSGIISTYAGTPYSGSYSGDGGPATAASLTAGGISLDTHGDLYVTGGSTVRMINPGGIITRVAGYDTSGSLTGGFGGDFGPATDASLNQAADAVVDASGDLCIADVYNSRIRLVSSRDPLSAPQAIANTGNLVLFPNPNNGSFLVTGSLGSTADEHLSIRVMDLLGRVVYKNETVARQGSVNTQITLDGSLPGGVYLLHLSHTGLAGAGGVCAINFVMEK